MSSLFCLFFISHCLRHKIFGFVSCLSPQCYVLIHSGGSVTSLLVVLPCIWVPTCFPDCHKNLFEDFGLLFWSVLVMPLNCKEHFFFFNSSFLLCLQWKISQPPYIQKLTIICMHQVAGGKSNLMNI